MTSEPLFELKDVRKTYRAEDGPVVRIKDLTLPRGKLIAVVGGFGSGKTTLLNLLAFLDQPDEGRPWSLRYHYRSGEGLDSREYSDEARNLGIFNLLSAGLGLFRRLRAGEEFREHRRLDFGFIFQKVPFIGNLKPFDNIVLPLTVLGKAPRHGEGLARRARRFLEGLSFRTKPLEEEEKEEDAKAQDILTTPVQGYSGGQQRLLAVLRALVHGPRVVFADEPDSNLDVVTRTHVIEGLRTWVDRGNGERSMIWVTHELELAAQYADHYLVLGGGSVVETFSRSDASREGEKPEALRERIYSRLCKAVQSGLSPPVKAAMLAAAGMRGLSAWGKCKEALFYAVGDLWPRNFRIPALSVSLLMLLVLLVSKVTFGIQRYLIEGLGDPRISYVEVSPARGKGAKRRFYDRDVERIAGLYWSDEGSVGGLFGFGPATGRKAAFPVGDARDPRLATLGAYGVYSSAFWGQGEDMFAREVSLEFFGVDPKDPYLGVLPNLKTAKGYSLSKDPEAFIETAPRDLGDSLMPRPGKGPAVIITRKALRRKLGYKDEIPEFIDVRARRTEVTLRIAGVVDVLRGSNLDMLVSKDWYAEKVYRGEYGKKIPPYQKIYAYLKSIRDARPIIEALKDEGYSPNTTIVQSMDAIFKITRFLGHCGLVVLALVAGVCLLNVGLVFVQLLVSKTGEIGLLKALGASRFYVAVLYLLESLIVWGVAVLITFVVMTIFDPWVSDGLVALQQITDPAERLRALAAFGITWQEWAWALGLGLAATLVTVLSAAFSVVKMKPADALRKL